MKINLNNPVIWRRAVHLLLGILLVARLATAAAYPWLAARQPAWRWENNDGYDTIALNWSQTGTYALEPGIPTACRLPLYPGLIALAHRLAGPAYPGLVMLLQALVSTLTGYVILRLGALLFGRGAGLAALALFTAHPQVGNFVFRCSTETLFMFWTTALVWFATRFRLRGRPRDLYAAAAALGLSLLTRQTLAPLLVPLLILPFTGRAGFACGTGVRARRALTALALIALILAPWVIRNHARSGVWPVLQTWVGHPMYQGVYVSRHLDEFLRGTATLTDLDRRGLDKIRGRVARYLDEAAGDPRPVAREVAADRYARGQAWRLLAKTPFASAARVLRNLALAPVLQMTWRSTGILILWNGPLLALCAIGLLRCRRDRPRGLAAAWPVVIVFGYLLAAHALTWPQARYILPGLAPFMVFAGHALAPGSRRGAPAPVQAFSSTRPNC